MHFRDADYYLDEQSFPSPTLAALHRTRSSDSLVAASDVSDIESINSSFIDVSCPSLEFDIRSNGSFEERDAEWSEDCTRELEEAMSSPQPKEKSPARGHAADVIVVEDENIDFVMDDCEVLANDPCQTHGEPKKSRLSFFSKRKAPVSKPAKPSPESNSKVQKPTLSISSAMCLFKRRQPTVSDSSKVAPRELSPAVIIVPRLELNDRAQTFFDQATEQRDQFVRFANTSNASLRLTLDDMDAINSALPAVNL